MRVTYIDHSGFFVETAACCLLFDYWRGKLPENVTKPLYIFASHSHHDHFAPEIFEYGARFPATRYILSSEITGPVPAEDVTRLAPDTRADFPELSIRALRSTDCGVAFLIETAAGEKLYHAGDLNLWLWGAFDTAAEAAAMTAAFEGELAKLRGERVDAAFLPLDPRQPRGQYWRGLDAYARAMDIAHIFPMHLWGKYETIARFKALPQSASYAARIADIEKERQIFEF